MDGFFVAKVRISSYFAYLSVVISCSCLCGKKEYGGTVETDITVFLCSCIASCQLKKISNKVKRDENSAEGAHEADNSTIDQDGMQDEGESHMSRL
jgi:hypothetical protein